MRQPTKLEKTLVIGLVVSLFLLANIFGFSALTKKRRALQLELLQLQGEKQDSAVYLGERRLWLDRKAWLDQKQPKVTQPDAAQPAFFQDLQKSARTHNLTINEQGFGEVLQTASYQAVSVRMRVGGTLEDVSRWVAELQQPELFQAVTNFSLRSEKDPPQVSLEIEIARWYAPQKA